MEASDKSNNTAIRSAAFVDQLIQKERELRLLVSETYKNEGFSKVNLLQRSLLEIIKEQNLNENSNNPTSPAR